MNDLGQWLRDTREARGLSLAEVEAQTRIRQKFLAALEAEEWDSLPNEAVTVGFLRNYAGFLGLDTATVMDQYRARSARQVTPAEETEMPGPREVDYRPIEFDLSTVTVPKIPWRAVAAVAALALVILGVWWLSATDRLPTARLSSIGALGQATSTAPLPEPTATIRVIRVTATPSPTAEPTATPTLATIVEATSTDNTATEAPPATPVPSDTVVSDTPAPQEGLVSSILMQLVASQRSWVRVVVDGQTAVETIFEPGQAGEWQGQGQVRLRTGNAAGIDVSINGEPQGALGGAGEVVDREWNLVDGQVVGTTPAPASSGEAG
jgi:cytoskeleton protein RodZ